MWQCISDIKTKKRAIRILLVISVIFCLFVIYVNMDNSFNTYTELPSTFRKISNTTLMYQKSLKASNSNFPMENANGGNNTFNTNPINGVSFENDIKEQLLLSQSDPNDTDSATETTNEYETYQVSNWTTEYSTESPSSSSETLSRDTGSYLSPSEKKQNTEIWRKIYVPKTADFMMINQRPFSRNRKVSSLFPSFSTFDKSAYDIMTMPSISFDQSFKNPCFRGTNSSLPIKDGRLHCLPYFYIIGVKKSGTSDFYSRLRHHPKVCTPSFPKESQWFSRFRFGIKAFSMNRRKVKSIIQRGVDPRKVEFYVSLFDSAATCIYNSPSRNTNDSLYYDKITVEASPSTLHMQTNWELLPGNEDLQEPRYTNFHYIKHITPNAKIIILFRNPTSRLYSDFLHSTRGKYGNSSGKVFHKHVTELIKAYENCFKQSSQRSCVYNNTLKRTLRLKRIELAESFSAGFYAVFMRDLLDVFGTSQILPILMSDYVTKMEETLEGAFKFLEMRPVSPLKMQSILKLNKKNVSSKKRKTGPMLMTTKAILDDFYKPYNEDMAELMTDKKYLFLE